MFGRNVVLLSPKPGPACAIVGIGLQARQGRLNGVEITGSRF